jgi:hypothetical protein
MGNLPYYKVRTGPNKRKGVLERFRFRNPKSRQLVVTVLGVYIFGGGLLGLFLFNLNTPDQAAAGQNSTISSSLRFLEEREYEIGDKVELVLTLQNTSITQPINGIVGSFYSTRDSLRWETGKNQLFEDSKIITVESANVMQLPPLAAGERAEYIITSTLKEKSTDFLAIIAKLSYENEIGTQIADTNRVYTALNSDLITKKQPLKLAADKDVYAPGEKVILTLSKDSQVFVPMAENMTGTVFVNRAGTGEVVNSYDCLPEQKGLCEFSFDKLSAGNYTAMFISSNEQSYSGIESFRVDGSTQSGSLVPSSQASLIIPFSAQSVNGYTSIIADRVISKNESPKDAKNCKFDVLIGTSIVYSQNATVTDTRKCYADIFTSQLPAAGIYTVQLANSNLKQDISFVDDTVGLIALTTNSPTPSRGQEIAISSTGIVDSQSAPISNQTVAVQVLHKESGKVSTFDSKGGQPLSVVDGNFNTSIPGNYFEQGGNYLIYIQLSSGVKSGFVSVLISDSTYGLNDGGVIIQDYSQLRVGQDISMRIEGVKDRSSTIISEGSCQGTVFATGAGTNGVKVDGKITRGVCNLTIPSGVIKKSGPVAITFSDGKTGQEIAQTKQLHIAAGSAKSYGQMYLQYEPAYKNYANDLIVGPIVDSNNNLTAATGLKLNLLDTDAKVIQTYTDIEFIEGYLTKTIPATILASDVVTAVLLDGEGNELLKKDFELVDSTQTRVLPKIMDSYSNDANISLNITGLNPEEVSECGFKFVKNSQEFLEEKTPQSEGRCNLTWNLNQLRDVSKAVIQASFGDNVYTKLVSLNSTDAGSMFKVFPQIRINSENELEINLSTTPITDRFGLPVESGEVVWRYNGKVEKSKISNGFAKLILTASKLESRDIQTNFDQRYLDLDLDVQASLTSLAQTNNISVYIGNFDISSQEDRFVVQEASNYISSQYSKIFKFGVDSCSAFIIDSNYNTIPAPTHKQGQDCYVQVSGKAGDNNLIFEDNGYTLGNFDFIVDQQEQEVQWCDQSGNKCNNIQVLAPISSSVTAIVYDGDNQYKFEGLELENNVKIEQNGLNPLKKYSVHIQYTDLDGKQIIHYKDILGEKLSQ